MLHIPGNFVPYCRYSNGPITPLEASSFQDSGEANANVLKLTHPANRTAVYGSCSQYLPGCLTPLVNVSGTQGGVRPCSPYRGTNLA